MPDNPVRITATATAEDGTTEQFSFTVSASRRTKAARSAMNRVMDALATSRLEILDVKPPLPPQTAERLTQPVKEPRPPRAPRAEKFDVDKLTEEEVLELHANNDLRVIFRAHTILDRRKKAAEPKAPRQMTTKERLDALRAEESERVASGYYEAHRETVVEPLPPEAYEDVPRQGVIPAALRAPKPDTYEQRAPLVPRPARRGTQRRIRPNTSTTPRQSTK